MRVKLFSEGKGLLQMRYKSIPNKDTATEMYKANNVVWQKHRIMRNPLMAFQ